MQDDEFGRGVYKAKYRKDGHEVLLAIDSRLDCIKAVVLRPGIDEDRATRYLEQLLEARERPTPQLRLVREPPPARFAPSGRILLGLMRH